MWAPEWRCSLERTKLSRGRPAEGSAHAGYTQLYVCCDEDILSQSVRFKDIFSLCKLWVFIMFFVSRWWWNTGKRSKGIIPFKLHTVTSSFLHEVEGEHLWKCQTKKITHGWKPRRSFLQYAWLWTFLTVIDQAPQNYTLSSLVLHGFSSKKEPIFCSIPFYLVFIEMPWAFIHI